MKWVNTDLNSPWYPLDELPYPRAAKNYPEQYRRVPDSLWQELRAAWDRLNEVSARVDKDYPIK